MSLLTFASTAFALFPLTYGQGPIGLNLSAKPKCVDGLQIITSSGTHQSGYSTIGGLTEEIKNGIPNSASVAVEYPHSEAPYEGSVASGIQNVTAYIKHYVDNCPDVRLGLIGYSQGAQISLSAVCGWPGGVTQSTQTFGEIQPLPLRYRNNIVGIVTYGDPTHSLPNAFDRGNSTTDGEFARPLGSALGSCAFFSNKIASWCDHGDQFCDNCPPPANDDVPNPRGCDINVHHTYWNIYNTDATNFMKQRYHEMFPASPLTPTASGGSGSSPTETSTPASSASASGSANPTQPSQGSGAGNLQVPALMAFAAISLLYISSSLV